MFSCLDQTMRRGLLGLLVLFGFAWGLSAGVGTAAGQTTMEFEIVPPPAGEIPTSRIDIKVEYSGASSAPSVTIDGATAQLGGFPQSFGSQLSAGEVRFLSTGSEEGVIRIHPLGTLQNNNNNCSADSDFESAQSYSLSLDLKGGTLDRYTLTSYRAPDQGVCSAQFDRNTNTPEGATWVLRPSTGTEGERLPLNVALVLDKSGSMRGSAGSKSKIGVLQEGVNQFIDNWRGLYATSRDPEAQEDDYLGTVFFEQNIDPVTVGSSFFVQRGGSAPSSSTHPWEPFNGAINGRSAGGRTAMGDGMQHAFQELDGMTEAQGGDQDRAMIVFTDGMQNEGDLVETCGYFQNAGQSGACGGGVANLDIYALEEHGSSSITTLPTRTSVIQTVYVGPPSSRVAEVMSGVAEQNGGMLNSQQVPRYDPNATTGTNPDFGFIEELMSVLKGFTPEIVLREAGSSSGSHTFAVTRTAEQVVATLNWLDVDREAALDIELVDPNQNVVEPDVRFDRDGYSVVAADLRDEPRPGTWTARVRPAEAEETSYHLTVVAEEEVFASDLRFRGDSHYTGGDLVVELQLTADGTPITEVDGVQGRVMQPSEGLGTLLHRRDADGTPQLRRLRTDDVDVGDPLSPYSRKLYHLYQDEEVREVISPTRGETISLTDDGSEASGDVQADDGIYTARLSDVQVPGTYKFLVRLDFETEELGPVRRTKTAETVVEVRPTLDASIVEIAGDGAIELIPRDRMGNYLGPGYAPRLHILTPEGELIQTEVSNEGVDGRYRVDPVEDLPPDQPFQLSLNGYTTEETSLVELGGEDGLPEDTTGTGDGDQDDDGGGLNPCTGQTLNSLFIVIGLVVIGFVTYRRRRRSEA